MISSSMVDDKDPETVRPYVRTTPIDKKVYTEFGNKCRSNNCEIGTTIINLMTLYLDKGETLFS